MKLRETKLHYWFYMRFCFKSQHNIMGISLDTFVYLMIAQPLYVYKVHIRVTYRAPCAAIKQRYLYTLIHHLSFIRLSLLLCKMGIIRLL